MKRWGVMMMLALLLAATGCGKINRENYEKLRIGMAYAEVVAILGTADNCDAVLGARNCIWKAGKKQITVQFMGDTVILFSAKGI